MKVLLVLLAVGLLIYAVIDCSRTPESDVPPGLPRSAWLVVMILLPIIGPIFWLVASRTEGNGRTPGQRPGSRPGSQPGSRPGSQPGSGRAGRAGPVGPDDDPDFLHGL